MSFIVLILALLTERFIHIDSYVHRFNWFESYLALLQKILQKSGLFRGIMGLILAVVPILIVVALVYYLFASFAWGFVGFILSIVILIYCLGPRDIYTRFEAYFVSVVRDDAEGQKKAAQKLACEIPKDTADVPRALTQSVFSQFNGSLFTVIFWFLILGPLAAVLYRCVAEVHKCAHGKNSHYSSMLASATWVMKIIEWIPNRIAALGFALMGDFHHGFSYWLRHAMSSIHENYTFIQETGLASLGITQSSDGTHDIAEIKSALRLVDRTLVLFVVVAALVVLGGIIY